MTGIPSLVFLAGVIYSRYIISVKRKELKEEKFRERNAKSIQSAWLADSKCINHFEFITSHKKRSAEPDTDLLNMAGCKKITYKNRSTFVVFLN